MSLFFSASSWLCKPQARDTHTWHSVTFPMAPDLDQFHHTAVVGMPWNLCAHLRGDASSLGGFDDARGLRHVVSQWLFTIHRLLHLQRRQHGEGVGVLGGGDDHRVDVLLLVIQTAVVFELRCGGELLRGAIQVLLVDVARGRRRSMPRPWSVPSNWRLRARRCR